MHPLTCEHDIQTPKCHVMCKACKRIAMSEHQPGRKKEKEKKKLWKSPRVLLLGPGFVGHRFDSRFLGRRKWEGGRTPRIVDAFRVSRGPGLPKEKVRRFESSSLAPCEAVDVDRESIGDTWYVQNFQPLPCTIDKWDVMTKPYEPKRSGIQSNVSRAPSTARDRSAGSNIVEKM